MLVDRASNSTLTVRNDRLVGGMQVQMQMKGKRTRHFTDRLHLTNDFFVNLFDYVIHVEQVRMSEAFDEDMTARPVRSNGWHLLTGAFSRTLSYAPWRYLRFLR